MAKKKLNQLDPAAITLARLIGHADPSTGKMNRGTVSELIALFSAGTPVKFYTDIEDMLANENLAIGYLAFVSDAAGDYGDPEVSAGWGLYLYDGPDSDELTSYRLITQENVGGGGGTSIHFGSTSGTNTYTIAATPAVTAYADGDLFLIKVVTGSTGSSTLNFDSVGAKKVYDNPDRQITVGDFEDNRFYLVSYDASLDTAAGGFIVVGDLNHERVTYRSGYDASTNLFPATGGSGPGGAVKVGDFWVVTVAGTLGTQVVGSRDWVVSLADTPGQTAGNWAILAGLTSTDIKLALKQTLINSATALTDASSMDLTAIKHTLTTSSATRTFTISYTGDDITIEVTLNTTASVFTFPAASLCVSDGIASGDNTCSLAGISGDKYIITTKKIGSAYYVISKNFGQ